jgi:hypothetical protein
MADVFATPTSAVSGGIPYAEWLALNYSSAIHCFSGVESVPIFATFDAGEPSVEHPRVRAGIVFTNPQKWRGNSEMSWNYVPLTVGRARMIARGMTDDLDADAPGTSASGADTEGTPDDGNLFIGNYEYLMNYVCTHSKKWVVMPLFCQIDRPPRGTKRCIPLQFASEITTGAEGGTEYSDEHIAVGYMTALQVLVHDAAVHCSDESLPQWWKTITWLLADFDEYSRSCSAVRQVILRLRSSANAADMTQRSLSFMFSDLVFSQEERVRNLETACKRSYKLVENLLTRETAGRLLGLLVLVPLLHFSFRGTMSSDRAAAHFIKKRQEIFQLCDTSIKELTVAAVLRDAGTDSPRLPALKEFGKTEVQLEAQLVQQICKATGLNLPVDGLVELLLFCKDREVELDEAAGKDADGASVVSKRSSSSFVSENKGMANRTSNWRTVMKTREDLAEAAGRGSPSSAASAGEARYPSTRRRSDSIDSFTSVPAFARAGTHRTAGSLAGERQAADRWDAIGRMRGVVAPSTSPASNCHSWRHQAAPAESSRARVPVVEAKLTASGIEVGKVALKTLAHKHSSARDSISSAATTPLKADSLTSTTTPKRWKVKTIGSLADLGALKLLAPVHLPIPLATSSIMRGIEPQLMSAKAKLEQQALAAATTVVFEAGSFTDPLAAAVSAAREECKVCVVPEFDSCPPGATSMDLLVWVVAPSTADTTRARMNIMTVLDVSGSMGGAKLNSLKETMSFVIEQLADGDRLSIVTFDHEAKTLLCFTELDRQIREEALEIIQSLHAGGGTSIGAGLSAALDDFEFSQPPDGMTAILLLTDGQDGDITAMCSRFQAGDSTPSCVQRVVSLNVPVHAFGYGADHEAKPLSILSKVTKGSFTYIEDISTVGEAFGSCIGGLMSAITNDVKLVLSVHPSSSRGATLVPQSCAFHSDVKADGSTVTFSIGSMYGEETRSVLVRVNLPTTCSADTTSPMQLSATISYSDLRTNTSHTVVTEACPIATTAVAFEDTSDAPKVLKRDLVVDLARNRQLYVDRMKAALSLTDAGRHSECSALLRRTIAELQSSASASNPATTALVDDIDAILGRSYGSQVLDRGTKASMLSAVDAHVAQRFNASSGVALSSAAAFQVGAQARMMLAASSRGAMGALKSSVSFDPLARRSQFGRSVATEAQFSTPPPAIDGRVVKIVNIRGTIVSSWAAFQLQACGTFHVRTTPLGDVSDDLFETGGTLNVPSNNTGANRNFHPWLRVSCGNVLFSSAEACDFIPTGMAVDSDASAWHAVETKFENEVTLRVEKTSVEVSCCSAAGEKVSFVLQRPEGTQVLFGFKNMVLSLEQVGAPSRPVVVHPHQAIPHHLMGASAAPSYSPTSPVYCPTSPAYCPASPDGGSTTPPPLSL